jgi:ParB family chromosome partitioning protein
MNEEQQLAHETIGANQVHEIPLEQIRPAPWNPPSRMDPDRVRELADSIRVEGQQSPALIRPVEAEPPVRYELVWGHRRYAA